MIVTIQEVHQEFTKNGDEYIKIKGITGDGKETTKSIFNNLKDKWHLLKQNATVDFKLEKKGQFWNTVGIEPIADKLPPPQEPKILPEHEKEIKEAVTPKPLSSPEIGLAYKEIGELYRAGLLDEQKPVDRKLIAKYKNWIIKTLGIEVEYKS